MPPRRAESNADAGDPSMERAEVCAADSGECSAASGANRAVDDSSDACTKRSLAAPRIVRTSSRESSFASDAATPCTFGVCTPFVGGSSKVECAAS